jgi:Ser/Thr protein kinase RdoA (MazF antagonist)
MAGMDPHASAGRESAPDVPYAGLTPDRILDALESVGLRGDGRLLPLNSYENRVYQVWIEDGAPVVMKFYRPGRWSNEAIREEHAYVQELAEREIPAVAPLALARPGAVPEAAPSAPETLHEYGGYRFAVYPRRGGRVPELDRQGTLEWIGRFVGRIHGVGALRPFTHRPVLDARGFGHEPREFLLAHDWLPVDLAESWRAAADRALEGVARCYERAGAVPSLRLHGDCYAGNILWTDDGPHFVDFDDSRMGPAVQDLWMLLSGEREAMAQQLALLLRGYERFREFDRRELLLVEALRTLRLLHYSAWIARRWHDPAFPAAFPWFGTQRYWQDRILELKEQVAAMEEGPLEPA